MAKQGKSPQEKKQLEYTRDHFTFGWHSSRYFPKTWKAKKAQANRQYRRKSQEILAPAKTGATAHEVEIVADDLTAARFQRSVSRKRLRKAGTVTVGEKIKTKLEYRREAVGRKVLQRQQYEARAASVLTTLNRMDKEQFVEAVRQAEAFCRGNVDYQTRVQLLKSQTNCALVFLLHQLGRPTETLRRNPALANAFQPWVEKAARIIERDKRAADRKRREKEAARKKAKLAALSLCSRNHEK